jgi:hypothetical protein
VTTTEDAVAKAIARDPDLLMKTVDLLLANSDAAPKDASAHPVRDAATDQVNAADAGRLFTQHGGTVLSSSGATDAARTAHLAAAGEGLAAPRLLPSSWRYSPSACVVNERTRSRERGGSAPPPYTTNQPRHPRPKRDDQQVRDAVT